MLRRGRCSVHSHDSCSQDMLPMMQKQAAYRNDGGGYVLASVNDLLDSGHTQGDVHTGHASKVKGFESHLGSRLSNALCPKSTNSGPCRHTGTAHRTAWKMVSLFTDVLLSVRCVAAELKPDAIQEPAAHTVHKPCVVMPQYPLRRATPILRSIRGQNRCNAALTSALKRTKGRCMCSHR